MRGVTLEEISAATRIGARFLRAIEDEKWDQLPGGVFNRGFVRAVARYLGLDEENIVAEYTLAVGDHQNPPAWTGSPPVAAPERPWMAWVVSTVILLALLGGGWFGTRRLLAWRAARQAARSATASAASSPASTPTGATHEPAPEPAPPNSDTSAPDNPGAIPGAPATDSLSTTAPVSLPSDFFELKIATSKRTKVTIVADQDVVYDGSMKPGENHFFSAMDHFQVSAKDAGVLHIELNGKTLTPIGPEGQAGKITLTRDTLKGVPGGGN